LGIFNDEIISYNIFIGPNLKQIYDMLDKVLANLTILKYSSYILFKGINTNTMDIESP